MNIFDRWDSWVANVNPWVRWLIFIILVVAVVVGVFWSSTAMPSDGAPVGVVPYPHPEMWRVP